MAAARRLGQTGTALGAASARPLLRTGRRADGEGSQAPRARSPLRALGRRLRRRRRCRAHVMLCYARVVGAARPPPTLPAAVVVGLRRTG